MFSIVKQVSNQTTLHFYQYRIIKQKPLFLFSCNESPRKETYKLPLFDKVPDMTEWYFLGITRAPSNTCFVADQLGEVECMSVVNFSTDLYIPESRQYARHSRSFRCQADVHSLLIMYQKLGIFYKISLQCMK